jgi:hypothetical protein
LLAEIERRLRRRSIPYSSKRLYRRRPPSLTPSEIPFQKRPRR